MTLSIGDEISDAHHLTIMQLHAHIQQLALPWIIDLIPAYCSITVIYNPVFFFRSGQSPVAMIRNVFENALLSASQRTQVLKDSPIKEIPVCYHPSVAPDIESLAQTHQLSIQEVIQLHSETTYRVYMNGFLPGFAYMGIVHEQIATPRLSIPRKSVPAGSVGIAGQQTGIYPLASPGGWQIIGRTPVELIDPRSDKPCLLEPGNRVRFVPIDLHELHNWFQS
jgi:inhibitor of KinA